MKDGGGKGGLVQHIMQHCLCLIANILHVIEGCSLTVTARVTRYVFGRYAKSIPPPPPPLPPAQCPGVQANAIT